MWQESNSVSLLHQSPTAASDVFNLGHAFEKRSCHLIPGTHLYSLATHFHIYINYNMDVNWITKEILIPYVLVIWVKWTGNIIIIFNFVKKKYLYSKICLNIISIVWFIWTSNQNNDLTLRLALPTKNSIVWIHVLAIEWAIWKVWINDLPGFWEFPVEILKYESMLLKGRLGFRR